MGDEGRCGSLTSHGWVALCVIYFVYSKELNEEFKLSTLILILIVNHFVVMYVMY